MSILTTFLAGFLLYGTSRYFPESLHAFQRYLVARKLLTRTLGILLMVVAVLMFSFHYTWGTAIIVFTATFITVLSLLIVSLKLSRYALIGWVAVIVVAVLIENI